MYGEWIIAHSSVKGGRHKDDNTSCQDANGVWYDEDAGFGLAIVSDGAGSATNAEKGSALVVQQALEFFRSKVVEQGFPHLLSLPREEIHSQIIDCFQKVYLSIQKVAETENIPLKSLAATVIVVLFGKEGIICSHIGDGRAGYQDLDDNWLPVLSPFKGEEANQTIFITSDIWNAPRDYIRTTVIHQPVKAFTLLSDGCETICFELNRFNSDTQFYERTNIPYARFFNPTVETLRVLASQNKTNAEINAAWTIYLDNGNEKFASETDDKTLIIGVLNSQNA